MHHGLRGMDASVDLGSQTDYLLTYIFTCSGQRFYALLVIASAAEINRLLMD